MGRSEGSYHQLGFSLSCVKIGKEQDDKLGKKTAGS